MLAGLMGTHGSFAQPNTAGALSDYCRHGAVGRALAQPPGVFFWSDNMSVVQVVNQQSARPPPVAFCCVFWFYKCLQFNVYFRARHVSGTANEISDALSR